MRLPLAALFFAVLSAQASYGIPSPGANVTEPSNIIQNAPTAANEPKAEPKHITYVTADTSVLDVINNPAFGGFGEFLFPTERGLPSDSMKLSNIDSLLPYHNNINPATTVSVINYLLDEVADRQTIFYDIYTDAEKRATQPKTTPACSSFTGNPTRRLP
ncbi:hypothetical protein FACS189460_5830 [Deltaproteobacteria bacterium]|nr:hypothetical protein FACS189460_5830 [Deltaproteobacteria bacterium]